MADPQIKVTVDDQGNVELEPNAEARNEINRQWNENPPQPGGECSVECVIINQRPC